jgi:Flp pilus assembly pilin Flp
MMFSDWKELVNALWRREPGQTMAEYGVVLAVITVGGVAVFGLLAVGVSGVIGRIAGFFPVGS